MTVMRAPGAPACDNETFSRYVPPRRQMTSPGLAPASALLIDSPGESTLVQPTAVGTVAGVVLGTVIVLTGTVEVVVVVVAGLTALGLGRCTLRGWALRVVVLVRQLPRLQCALAPTAGGTTRELDSEPSAITRTPRRRSFRTPMDRR